jgi:hypothetical protein
MHQLEAAGGWAQTWHVAFVLQCRWADCSVAVGMCVTATAAELPEACAAAWVL